MTTVGRPGAADMGCVVARMRGLGGALPYGDGVAVFNRVYLSVTEEVRRRLAAGEFADPYTAGELAVRFAGRYLAAVEDDAAGLRPRPASCSSSPRTASSLGPPPREPGRQPSGPPACWRALLRMRRHRGVRPLQFALAGINAHIGHDLALAVVDTCRATGRRPTALEGDFDRIGDVLAGVETRVREELMPGPDLLDSADPLTHLVGAWSLERARDAAWAAARLLWALRRSPDAYEECAARLDAGVGLVGRFLLTPLDR
ncbi:DUF5995 family protein [Streptomyces sp.]|uniref:DUF5995 family protein n=1 Tax=Streptomyces sp. TaxID=1931 RepID=UPI002F3EF018